MVMDRGEDVDETTDRAALDLGEHEHEEALLLRGKAVRKTGGVEGIILLEFNVSVLAWRAPDVAAPILEHDNPRANPNLGFGGVQGGKCVGLIPKPA